MALAPVRNPSVSYRVREDKYQRLKREFERNNPRATPAEYQAKMLEFARRCKL